MTAPGDPAGIPAGDSPSHLDAGAPGGTHARPPARWRRVAPGLFVFGTVAVFLAFSAQLLSPALPPAAGIAVFAWLFAAVVTGSLTVVENADELAILLGEPYGTLILTLSVGSIEIVTVGVVMLTGAENPTLARDTMFSVVMIVMNGLVGLALLLGGWRYHEQEYNLRGVHAYLGLIVVLATVGLILPYHTTTSTGPTLSRGQEVFLIVMCPLLYAIFLTVQTTRHRAYFSEVARGAQGGHAAPVETGRRVLARHAITMVLFLAATILLAEKLAVVLNEALDTFGLPPELGALAVAVLVLVPEGLGAIQAALANQMQRSMNILLGSALATVSMTIPAVLILAATGNTQLHLGLPPADQVMLVLTLLTAMLTFGGGWTNILQGAIHLALFIAYLLLIVIP